MLAPRLSARFGLHHATLVGLGSAVVGGVALVLAVLVARNSLLPFLVTASIFLFGLGIASPLSSAAALSPFGDKAGARGGLVRLLANGGGRMRRVAGGCPRRRPGHRAWNRAGADVFSRAGPACVETAAGVIGRRFFTATAPAWLRLILFLSTKCATSCDRTTRRRHRRGTVAQMLRGRTRNIRCIPSINCGSLAHTGQIFGQPKDHPRPALGVRIWTWLLAALHEFAEAGSRAGDPPASGSHSEFPGDRTSRPWDGSKKPCMIGKSGCAPGLSTYSSQP